MTGIKLALVVAAVCLSQACLGVGPTQVDAGATPVGDCTELDEPGRYELTQDLTTDAGQCLVVSANDVVVDGGGHAVRGEGRFGTAGVVVGSWERQTRNVTVRNLTVANWDDSVRATRVSNLRVDGVVTRESRVGLALRAVNQSVVASATATRNSVYGVSLSDRSRSNRLRNVTATENALFGVHLVGDATNTTLTGVLAARNDHGIALVGSRNTTVRDSRAVSNRVAGVWSSAARGTRVTNTTLTNRLYGVALADGTTETTLDGNTVVGNAVGVRLRDSDGNRVLDNDVRDNRDGVLLIESNGALVARNDLRNNGRAVTLLSSDDGRVVESSLAGNERGVAVRRGSRNVTVAAN
ncbi:right-handed parallel beta-helix repeat-containing protein [Haloprofundus salinisoli]|uniref:right-handed parallel beta-helix repeat-containing protein n=1 Tax=Haloprofundus salinisoli TaxID=2876193 RepID=UPI001CCF10C3|nr:NosD domain-containing protein [Haloprofundus salinisoli]